MAEHMLPFLQINKELPSRDDPNFEKAVFDVLVRKNKEFEAFERSQTGLGKWENQSHYINHMRNAIVCNFHFWSHELDQTKWWKKLPKTYVLHGPHDSELHIKRASRYVMLGERYVTHKTAKYAISPGFIPTKHMLYLAAWQVYFDYGLITGLSQFAQDLVSYQRID